MEKKHYKLSDFVVAPSSSMIDPQSSSYDRFVGLEHYDTREPVISRYSGKDILSSTVKEFRQGDLLIARRNVYLERAGIALFDGITSGDSIILRVKDNCEDATGVPVKLAKRILPFVLNSNSFWSFANRHADGMNSKRISKDKLLEFEFSLPSVKEQESLSEKLWVAYELKQSYIKMIEATDEMVKSQFIEMVNTSNCEKKLIREISSVERKSVNPIEGTTYTLHSFPAYDNNKLAEVVDGREIKSSKLLLTPNTILYNKLNVRLRRVWNIRDLYTENNICSTEFIPLHPNESIIIQEYLSDFLKSDEVTLAMEKVSQGTSNSQQRISPNSILDFEIPVLPLAMQREFIRISQQADKSKFELKKSIAAIDKVIKSLINENI